MVQLAVPEKCFRLTLIFAFFDRCAFSRSLYLPQAALALEAQTTRATPG